jgi:8-oxo-dGTP diphosphatase
MHFIKQLNKTTKFNHLKTATPQLLPIPYSHCHFCGDKYTDPNLICKLCTHQTFKNPVPVAVALLPFVDNNNSLGLLLTERAINPFIGKLCLPGGFINDGENWKDAISREVFEETTLETDPNEFSNCGVYSTPDARRILLFGLSRKLRTMDQLKNFTKTNETNKIVLGNSNTVLCFSIHQDVYDSWFNRLWLNEFDKNHDNKS